jgi:hypothetical protein
MPCKRFLTRAAVLAAVSLLLVPPACRAEFLLDTPIVTSVNGTLEYTASTGNFHTQSQATIIANPDYPGGSASFVTPGQVTIDFFVDKTGKFVSNGLGFQMSGSLDFSGHGTVTGVLLTGTIILFEAPPPGPPPQTFGGLFAITGGLLTQDIVLNDGETVFGGFPVGAFGGFILIAENVSQGTLGDFADDFASTSVKDQEGVAGVPQPSSWALALLGSTELGILDFIRRRRRKREAASRVASVHEAAAPEPPAPARALAGAAGSGAAESHTLSSTPLVLA